MEANLLYNFNRKNLIIFLQYKDASLSYMSAPAVGICIKPHQLCIGEVYCSLQALLILSYSLTACSARLTGLSPGGGIWGSMEDLKGVIYWQTCPCQSEIWEDRDSYQERSNELNP